MCKLAGPLNGVQGPSLIHEENVVSYTCKQNFVIACGYFLVEGMYECDSTLYLGDPSCNRENVQSCVAEYACVYPISWELFLE